MAFDDTVEARGPIAAVLYVETVQQSRHHNSYSSVAASTVIHRTRRVTLVCSYEDSLTLLAARGIRAFAVLTLLVFGVVDQSVTVLAVVGVAVDPLCSYEFERSASDTGSISLV